MATRFYLPSGGGGTGTITPDAGWAVTTDHIAADMPRAKVDTPLVESDPRTKDSTALTRRLDRQYVSDALGSDQTISGTFSAVLRCKQSATSHNSWLDLIIRVVSGDGTVIRGVLWAGSTATAASATLGNEAGEMATGSGTPQTRVKNGLTLTSVDALAGDRIVVEIGYKADTTSTSTTSTICYGDPAAAADHSLSAGITSALTPWVQLSQDLVFGTTIRQLSATGSGQSAGTATTISSSTPMSASGSGTSTGSASFGGSVILSASGTGVSSGSGAGRLLMLVAASGASESAGAGRLSVSGIRGGAPPTLRVLDITGTRVLPF